MVPHQTETKKIAWAIGMLTTSVVFAMLLTSGLDFTTANAQVAPTLFLSWKSLNYAPSGFEGKILPIHRSEVLVAAELISAGRLADLSRNEVRWFLGGELYREGRGLKSTVLTVPPGIGDRVRLKVALTFQGKPIEKEIFIPVVKPFVTLSLPSSEGRVTPGIRDIEALPYFFNIKDLDELSFTWSANGSSIGGDDTSPGKITLDLERGKSGSEVLLSMIVSKKGNPLETAAASRIITIE